MTKKLKLLLNKQGHEIEALKEIFQSKDYEIEDLKNELVDSILLKINNIANLCNPENFLILKDTDNKELDFAKLNNLLYNDWMNVKTLRCIVDDLMYIILQYETIMRDDRLRFKGIKQNMDLITHEIKRLVKNN